MKVLTFPTRILWEWQFVCELEIIDTFSENNYHFTACVFPFEEISVEHRATTAELELSPWQHYWRKKWYLQKVRNNYGRLNQEIPISLLERPELSSEFKDWVKKELKNAKTLKELTKIKYKGFPVGAAAVSSFTHHNRRIEVDLEEFSLELEMYFHCSYAVYLMAKKAISEEKPDAVMFFNGRLATQRGIFEAAQEAGVKTMIHERGCSFHHYEIFENGLIHDRELFKVRLEKWVTSTEPSKVQQLGNDFFLGRREGDSQIWKNFLENQKTGALPTDMDHRARNIAVFISSEDEFFSIGEEWDNPFFPSQYDGVQEIVKNISSDFHFWVRLHPNLKEVPAEELEKWDELERKHPSLSVIKPESEIDSYSLMEHCEKVLSFGSTVGLEATYWGKPSILLSVCFYQGLNAVYEPSSVDEALSLIEEKNLSPKAKENTLTYGAYFKGYGTPFVHAQPISYFLAKYKGQIIQGHKYYGVLAWGLRKSIERFLSKMRPS